MSTGTRFHTHQTRLELCKEVQYFRSTQLSPELTLAAFINAVNNKYRFGQIQADAHNGLVSWTSPQRWLFALPLSRPGILGLNGEVHVIRLKIEI